METKAEKYECLLMQLQSLLDGETDVVARMANIAAAVHGTFGFWWTGFYRVCGDELVLGPFQGPVACMHIPFGKGVCGTAWKEARTVVVPDVEKFPGHIACSAASRSEIVVPVWSVAPVASASQSAASGRRIVAVLDIDSASLATFDSIDAQWLGRIAELIIVL